MKKNYQAYLTGSLCLGGEGGGGGEGDGEGWGWIVWLTGYWVDFFLGFCCFVVV